MKNIKSVLALIMAVCLMMSLAVPAFATEADGEVMTVLSATDESAAATDPTEEAADPTEEIAEPVEEESEELAEEEADEHEGHDHSEEATTTGTTETEEVSGTWKTVRLILTVLEVIAGLIMVIVILLQSGKEAGLSGAISGNSDSYANKNGMSKDKKLAKATKWVAVAWLLLTLALSLIP